MLEAEGATVETREIHDEEVRPALLRRLIAATNELAASTDDDRLRKLAEVSATFAEVQLDLGVTDSELADEQAQLAIDQGPLRPYTIITTVGIPDGSELADHPIFRDTPRQDTIW